MSTIWHQAQIFRFPGLGFGCWWRHGLEWVEIWKYAAISKNIEAFISEKFNGRIMAKKLKFFQAIRFQVIVRRIMFKT